MILELPAWFTGMCGLDAQIAQVRHFDGIK